MTGWRRICCAVSGSESERAVAREAAHLAARSGAQLVLLHVDEQAAHGAEPLFAPPPRPRRTARDAPWRLATWAADAEALGADPVRTCIIAGRAMDAIPRFVAEEGCDLLVVAAPEGGAVRRWVRAARMAALLRRAECDVLVVPSVPPPARHREVAIA
jgi:nucleotide-binding universal stress UspA family protein